MSSGATLRAVPVEDRAWLLAALADALQDPRGDAHGGSPILPMAPGTDPGVVRAVREQSPLTGTAVVVRTSGSSGVPKAVALSAAALRASAVATHEALAAAEEQPGSGVDIDTGTVDIGLLDTGPISTSARLNAEEGGPGSPGELAMDAPQWLVALPGHLISGLQMLVRSLVAGTDPVFVDGPFDPEKLLAAAEHMHHPRRYVSLVPVQLARLLDLAERDAGAADAARGFSGVLVGGQSVPLGLRRRAHDLGIALRRSYGMTETAGGCVYDGVEIGDTRVRIRDGEVQIAGSSLALGYVGEPERTADRFIVDRGRDGVDTRWYRTGDAGELLGGMLTVAGRLDRVIISGGVNVSLDEIERVAGEQPGWAGAVAVGVNDEEWGERPVLVVATDGEPRGDSGGGPGDLSARAAFEEVRSEIRNRLGPAAAPARVVEVDDVPRLSGGKPDRAALAELVRAARA